MADSSDEAGSFEKAQSKVFNSGSNVTTDSFNKAWDRVYGNRQYKPSWVGSASGRLPPPKPLNKPIPKKKEPEVAKKNLTTLEEESKRRQKTKSTSEESSPAPALPPVEQEKPKPRKGEVLTINGKELPKEPELESWKKQIECDEVGPDGRPVYNKIVKQSNISGWMTGNSYWEASSVPGKPQKGVPKLPEKKKPPRKIYTAKYDITVYENKVKREDLKIGEEDVPKEEELKSWSDGIEIPDKLDGCEEAELEDDEQASEKRKNWNRILNTADVPGFFSNNNYWA